MGVEGPERRKYILYIGRVRNLISTVSGPTINNLMMPNLITRRSVATFVLFHVIDKGGAT